MFCSQCGEALLETAYFCLKCGVMTSKGVEAGVSYPWKWEKEVEKTLSTVAKEMGKAVDNIRDSIRKSTKTESVSCSHCGEKNLHSSKFCYKCGTALN